MRRVIGITALLLIVAGSASADYILVRININQYHIFPPNMPVPTMPQPPGPGMGGGVPGAMGGAVPGAMGGAVPGAMGGATPGAMMGGAGMMGNTGGTPMPKIPTVGGGFGGFTGGGFQLPVDPSNPNPMPAPVIPEDPNPRYITAWIEVKNKPQFAGWIPGGLGIIYQYEHRWGKKAWLPLSPLYPHVGFYYEDKFVRELDNELKEELRRKNRNVENVLHVARKALERVRLDKFHNAMKEATDLDPKHPNVKLYQKVKNDLAFPIKEDDPNQLDLIRELRDDLKFKAHYSSSKRFCLLASYAPTDKLKPVIDRRLELMEESLECFYYWFALQKCEPRQPLPMQPAVPKHRLLAVMKNTKSDFIDTNKQWGGPSIVGDGYTPRRDNVIILSTKPRILDPIFQEFDSTVLPDKLRDANGRDGVKQFGLAFNRDELLSGKATEQKYAGQAAIFIGSAQLATLVARTLEDQAERSTISHQVVRQLLTASGTVPRNVKAPDWIIEGIAAFLETPDGGIYPAFGSVPNLKHLVSFKHLYGKSKDSANVLFDVVTDRYFQEARRRTAEALETGDPAAMRRAVDEWERARCTAWSFVYFLAQNGKMDLLLKYGKELDALPRDFDVPDSVVQRSFAKAFEMTDTKDPRRIALVPLGNMAASWFTMMQETNLSMPAELQTYYQDERARRDGGAGPATPPVVPPAGKTGAGSGQ